MKRRTEKQSDEVMKFFTRDLYLRFNSSNEEEADRADADWEAAVAAYNHHLKALRDNMPSTIRRIADLCLHDAEVLALDKDIQPLADFGPEWAGLAALLAMLSVNRGREILTLIYLLADKVTEHPWKNRWPFSAEHKHWLCDEIDTGRNRPSCYCHRVLFSDGNVLEMPFISVVIQVIPLALVNAGAASREIA